MEITKDTLLNDAFQMGNAEEIANVLAGFGMHCFGCALAHGETIEQAAAGHGVDVNVMIKALNDVCKK